MDVVGEAAIGVCADVADAGASELGAVAEAGAVFDGSDAVEAGGAGDGWVIETAGGGAAAVP